MPPKSKLPKTMQRLSPYRSPRKRKAFIYSYQSFHARCFRKIQHIDGKGICVREMSLDYLDLAVGAPCSNRMWDKFIQLRIIRSLPPFCAEYLTPETKLHGSTMLGTVLRKMAKSLLDIHSAYKDQRRAFNKGMYLVLESYILRLGTFSFAQKKVLIRNYLRVVKVFGVFDDDSNERRFSRVFHALLETMCSEYPADSVLAVTMLQAMCADDDLKLSVFLEVKDRRTLEYLLCSARDEGFDFWGVWRGVGRLSARFNPVAVMFGYGRNELARTLLSYGFQYSNVGTVYEDRCHSLTILRYRDLPIINPHHIQRLKEKRPRDRMLLILDILVIFGEFDNPCNIPDKVSTLVQISRSLPDSYVTPMELFNSLANVINLAFFHKLIRICHKYGSGEVYDDDCRVHRPRRLAHLSRCAVRASLAEHLWLPLGIEALGLEESLRAYLSLEC